jgi:hypothetical protein
LRVSSPIAHPLFVDLALENDRSRGKDGREKRHAAKSHPAMTRGVAGAFEKATVTLQHLETAAAGARRHVVGRYEALKRALEIVGLEMWTK